MARRFGMILLAAGALAAALVSGASATSACTPAGSHTLAHGSEARVYSVGKTVYGCAYSTGRAWKLGTTSFCNAGHLVQSPTVAGVMAAYGLKRCGVDTGSASVVVRRLTDGKRLVDDAATVASAGAESYQDVDSLVLRATGAVAWIGSDHSIIGRRGVTEVREIQKGSESLLDSGPAVRTSSLRLHGMTLTWKHGSQTRTASLC